MANTFFQFKQFVIHQDKCAMKVTTDGCLFGAWATHYLHQIEHKNSILDIGAGTGLLSLMLAQQFKDSQIKAVEIQKEDFQQCLENVQLSTFSKNIQIEHTAIQELDLKQKFDIIISNPPFYQDHLKGPNVHKNKAHHHESLDFSSLSLNIKNRLETNGTFFLLIPYVQLHLIEKELNHQHLFIHHLCFAKQTEKHDYFRVMLTGGYKKNDDTTTSEIIIKENNIYTEKFKHLLAPYYLHF